MATFDDNPVVFTNGANNPPTTILGPRCFKHSMGSVKKSLNVVSMTNVDPLYRCDSNRASQMSQLYLLQEAAYTEREGPGTVRF